MSSAPSWRLLSPAPRTAALDLAGSSAAVRRRLLAQVREADSIALYRGDQAIALAMFDSGKRRRRVEMAFAVAPIAARYMRQVIRAGQLTLARAGQDRLIVTVIDPANFQGQRMAVLTGFRRAWTQNASLWVFR
jgi:hypothetical protein